MDPRWQLRSGLRDLVWSAEQAEQLGLVYRGPADFVLREGRWWTPRPRPRGLPQGRPRGCYANAIYGGEIYGLRYVQGYALGSVDPEIGAIPHAWNVDADGNVVDLTWNPVGLAYLGVVLDRCRADDATWFGDADPIDDYRRGWPLLRERWRGRDPGGEWEPSPPLLAVRAKQAGDMEEALRQWLIAEREQQAG